MTTTTRDQVIAEARAWIATPFQHQGRTRGLGCDCRGLVGGVAVALGLVPPDWWIESFDPHFGGYPEQPPPDLLTRACDSFMTRTDSPQPGDVVVVEFLRYPQHMGILTNYVHGGLAIVHSLRVLGVREHRLAPGLNAQITQGYVLPGVA
jgi:cell wall-associated NlpC family hydrolase